MSSSTGVKKPYVFALVTAVLVIAVVCAFLLAHPKKVILGTKEAVREPFLEPYQDQMRTWLQNLSEQDMRALQQTGSVTLSYQDLQTSDPSHAAFLARYVEDRLSRTRMNMPPELGDQLPESITFEGSGGAYKSTVTCTKGTHMHLKLSKSE